MASDGQETDAREAVLRVEFQDLNLEFLQLLARRGADHPHAWGLDPDTHRALASLNPVCLQRIARVPCLLAAFAPVDAMTDPQLHDRPVTAADEEARLYAVALMSWFWLLSRRHPVLAALCAASMNVDPQQLAILGFRDLQREARQLAGRLHAAHAGHPRFWSDLIEAARSGDPRLLIPARLCVLPLGLIRERPGPRGAVSLPSGLASRARP